MNYSILEKKVISIFQRENHFTFNNNFYKLVTVGKPRARKGGECKTDVYVLGINTLTSESLELKISCKLHSTNEFQENKFTPTSAENLLGKDWANIVQKTALNIKEKFYNTKLIGPNGYGRTKEPFVTLGWKLEVTTKSRNLSSKISLSDKEIQDYVYKGTNQPDEKKHAYVNGEKITDSGIAEFLLITELDQITSTEDIIRQLIPISDYKVPDTYLVFTANNYRIPVNKTDGNRYLAVRIEWENINNQLTPFILFDHPLQDNSRSNDMKKLVDLSLDNLGKQFPYDFNFVDDISDTRLVY